MVLSVSFMYNHSLILVQCIKLSELKLQQRLTQSPWAFREILLSYLKFEIAKLFTFIFWNKLADLWFRYRPTICLSMHVGIIINVRRNPSTHFRINRKKTSDFRRYEITYRRRKYDQATFYTPKKNEKYEKNELTSFWQRFWRPET